MNLIKRYKRSDESVRDYHDKYDKILISSRILNSDAVPNIGSFIADRKNIEIELMTLVGQENGEYRRDKLTYTASIPLYEQKLKDLEIKFEKINLERELNGLPTFEQYPTAMQRERLQLEAMLDVLLSEKAFLEERLKAFKKKESDERNSRMLKFGLRQNIQMRESKISEIDGQKVLYMDNIPVIAEDHSPYWGMSVADYRKLSNIWLENQKKAETERFLKTCEARKREGLPLPTMMKVSSSKAVDKSSLPPFPEWAKRLLTV